MASSTTVLVTQVTSITTALLAAGGILTLSLFDIPELQSQPASRSLPQLRWMFSRGSHVFPQAAELSTAGFLYLAYAALPPGQRSFSQIAHAALSNTKVGYNVAAAGLLLAIVPFTQFAMVPTNFALMKMNEEKGGFRSASSAKENAGSSKPGQRSAEDSVNSKGETSQFTDLSGPQEETTQKSTPAEDRRANELLGKFALLNYGRAALVGGGAVVGLLAALLP
ncbi:hypothetical protein AMS68_006580 [Peltaster fructicola]|uniref:DUF1772-domain-containing protein n=1 Tax=Peltaster fructicola TaxID=286661 RepID=A0A6H0Y213_9PEZI|nr:hypothetical protein AMS68_006580 [Peltaster fructicola]